MTARDAKSLSIETARLGFDPSERLRTPFLQLYDPLHQQDGYNLVLYSKAAFMATIRNGLVRPYPYYQEPHGESTVSTRIDTYRAGPLRRVGGHSFPLSTSLRFAEMSDGSLRVYLRTLPLPAEKHELSQLDDLIIDRRDATIPVFAHIPAEVRAMGSSALSSDVYHELAQLLQVPAPTDRTYLNERRLVNNPDVFVTHAQLVMQHEVLSSEVEPAQTVQAG